jgi:hypothetical protein
MTGAPNPRFPVEFRGFPAPFLNERRTRDLFQSCVQEIRGICLVLADVGFRRTRPWLRQEPWVSGAFVKFDAIGSFGALTASA